MSFRMRILLGLLAVGVAPVAILGRMSYEANRQELIETVGSGQAHAAAEIARQCESFVLGSVEHLQAAASYLPFAHLSAREAAAATLDALAAEYATVLAEPVFDGGAELGREPIGPRELDAFARSVPLATALASDVAIGPPYLGARTGVPRVAIAVRVQAGPAPVLAAELSLKQVSARLQEIASADGTAFLVDGRGQVIAHGSADPALSPEERQLVERGVASLRPEVRSVRRSDGAAWLAAFAPVGTLGWGVVLATPEAGLAHRGSVADYLEVEPGSERAVEAALGELLQYVVVDTHTDAERGLAFARERSAGRCGFVVASQDVPAGTPRRQWTTDRRTPRLRRSATSNPRGSRGCTGGRIRRTHLRAQRGRDSLGDRRRLDRRCVRRGGAAVCRVVGHRRNAWRRRVSRRRARHRRCA